VTISRCGVTCQGDRAARRSWIEGRGRSGATRDWESGEWRRKEGKGRIVPE